jgi:hypothetical protein
MIKATGLENVRSVTRQKRIGLHGPLEEYLLSRLIVDLSRRKGLQHEMYSSARTLR